MNKRIVKRAMAGAGLLLATSAAGAAELPACGGELADTVDAFNAAWVEAVQSGRADRIAEFYAPDAVLMPPSDTTLVGAAPISGYFVETVRDDDLTEYSVDLVSCERSPRSIMLAGVWGTRLRTDDGATVMVTGNLVRVLEQTSGGSWKSAYEIWN